MSQFCPLFTKKCVNFFSFSNTYFHQSPIFERTFGKEAQICQGNQCERPMTKKLILIASCSLLSIHTDAQFWNTSDARRLEGTVNTGAEESSPVFSRDMSTLYFVRGNDPMNAGGETDQDIWFATRNAQGQYDGCDRLKDLNNKFNNAVVSLSKSDAKMYVLNSYMGKKDLEKGLAVSDGGGDGWNEPVKVEIPDLNIEGDFYGFYVNEDESVILVSYQGPNSKGNEDLYFTARNGNSWSPLTHMGGVINSAGYEIGPYLNSSNDTLFFSSNGFGGEGDADIFYSVKQGSWTSWSKPVNLGPKVNSPKFDAYFSHNGTQAFWSSSRDGELSDIYTLDILSPPALTAKCTSRDASGYNMKDGAALTSVNGAVEPISYQWTNGDKTKDLENLGKGEYSVTVTDGLGRTATASCAITQPAEPIAIFENHQFKYNYGYNKNELQGSNKEYLAFLETIEKEMKAGRQSITIRINSSASMVPTKTFGTNERLAQTRAENMQKQLKAYFAKKDWKDKVNIEIGDVKVQGPAYEEDSANQDRYIPYQFIQLLTK